MWMFLFTFVAKLKLNPVIAMRKFLLLSIIFLSFVANTNAQQYSINKNKYDYRLYSPQYGDPNNPAISGVCSFLIPGLGQMVSGEVGRGLSFLGG